MGCPSQRYEHDEDVQRYRKETHKPIIKKCFALARTRGKGDILEALIPPWHMLLMLSL